MSPEAGPTTMRIKFGLLTFLLIVVFVAFFVCLIAERYRDRRLYLTAIKMNSEFGSFTFEESESSARSLNEVRSVSIDSKVINDKRFLEVFSACENVSKIEFRGSTLCTSFDNLLTKETLEHLSFVDSSIDCQDLVAINTSPIRILSFERCSILLPNSRLIFNSVSDLRISETTISSFPGFLKQFPNLKSLNIYDCQINGEIDFQLFPLLRFVRMNALKDDQSFGFLSTIVDLELLDLCNNKIPTRLLANISGKQITEIRLSGCRVDDTGLATIGHVRGLKKFEVAFGEISEKGLIKFCAANRDLEFLDVSCNPLRETFLEEFGKKNRFTLVFVSDDGQMQRISKSDKRGS